MVKKCLIAIAVVALLATTVQAIDSPGGSIKQDAQTEGGGWPWTQTKVYDTFDICTFDVILEVGHYVQILNCDDLEMKLIQVSCDAIGKDDDDFPCYGDIDETDTPGPACVTVTARANFDAIFGANFDGSAGDVDIIGGSSVGFVGGDEIPGDGNNHDLKLCMAAWSVELWNSGGTSGTVKVGEITITVKPKDVVTYGP